MMKKLLAVTVMLSGLAAMNTASASAAADVEAMPVVKFQETLTFSADSNAPAVCQLALPPLVLSVDRDHSPGSTRKSILTPAPGSPYSNAFIVSSDPFDAKRSKVRHYVDNVTFKSTVITLLGQSKPRGGVWSYSQAGQVCTGTYTAT